MDAPRTCAICNYELARAELCPECGVAAPRPAGSGYWPGINGQHAVGGNFDYKVVTKGELSVLVAPPFPSSKRCLISLAALTPFLLIGLGILGFASEPLEKCFGLAFALVPGLVVAIGFGSQLLKSRESPMLTVDHAAKTITLPYRSPIPLASICGIELVRYALRNGNFTSHGHRRIVFEFLGSEWYEFIIVPARC